MTGQEMDEQPRDRECCPRFDPSPWDDKVRTWTDKRFIKDRVVTLLHIPMNFGGVMKRMNRRVESAGASTPDWLCLSDHRSKWSMDVFLAVDRHVPDAENVTISGQFLSKVYEGDFRETGKWCGSFAKLAAGRGLNIKKMYMWYTTCPKCAKKYGKNYVVIVSEVEAKNGRQG